MKNNPALDSRLIVNLLCKGILSLIVCLRPAMQAQAHVDNPVIVRMTASDNNGGVILEQKSIGLLVRTCNFGNG